MVTIFRNLFTMTLWTCPLASDLLDILNSEELPQLAPSAEVC